MNKVDNAWQTAAWKVKSCFALCQEGIEYRIWISQNY